MYYWYVSHQPEPPGLTSDAEVGGNGSSERDHVSESFSSSWACWAAVGNRTAAGRLCQRRPPQYVRHPPLNAVARLRLFFGGMCRVARRIQSGTAHPPS